MAARLQKRYALCINNAGYAAALDVRKVYAVLPDAQAEAEHLFRVIDESGEDYLYPQAMFVLVTLPPKARRAIARVA